MFAVYFSKIKHFLQLDQYFFISLFFLIVSTLIFFKEKNEERRKNYFTIVLLITALIFLIWSVILTIAQYYIWKNHPFSKYLLPPYQSIRYFFEYSYFHFWRDLFFRFLGVAIVFLLMKSLNFILSRDVFYEDEKVLIPYLSLFFLFPYNMFFICIGFFMLLLIIGFLIGLNKLNLKDRYSFKEYWLFLCWFLFFLQPLILTNYSLLKYIP